MGWVDEEETAGSRFPVDDFIRKLEDAVRGTDNACTGFGGQVRRCCDGAKNCFTTLEDSFASIKLAAIGNQSMHKACKSFSESLQVATDCVSDNTDTCHWSVNTDYVINPFHETLDSLEKLKDDHCSDLPLIENTTRATIHNTTTNELNVTTKTTTATTKTTTSKDSPTSNTNDVTSGIMETTVTKTSTTTRKQDIQQTTLDTRIDDKQTTKQQLKSTTKTSTDSKTTTTTVLTTPEDKPVTTESPKISINTTLPFTNTTTSLGTTSSTPVTTSGSSNSTMAIDRPESPGTNSGNTIIIISVITGSLLLIIAVILCFVIKRRRREAEKSTSGGSFDPDRSNKSTLLRRLFRKSKNKSAPHNDTEIYAEIDDAFMEAVYKCGDDKQQKPKKEILRERLSSNTQINVCYEATFEDNVIKSRDSLKRDSLGDQPMSMVSLSPMELIRNQDEAVTSFQTDQSGDHHKNSKSTNQNQFLISKPSFTDIRSDEPNYVYIDARNEPIYAEPSVPSFYDSAQYGRNPARNISQAPANVYSSFSDFMDTESVNAPRIYDRVRHREYKRSGSDVDINFYENHDTMMEY